MFKIVIDSREQRKLEFRKSKYVEGTIVKKLDVGDYSIEGEEDRIVVERKSQLDLFGTLGCGHSRFKRELERAKDHEHFIILIEDSYSNIRDKTFPNSWRTKMRGDVVVQILFTLMIKYNIKIFFTNTRNESAAVVREIFKAYYKCEIKKKK